MSAPKEPFKSYWAYTSPCIDGTTYLFNTYSEAYQDAVGNGEFEDCFGKDAWYDREEGLFFEIHESDLQDYLPMQFVKGKAA